MLRDHFDSEKEIRIVLVGLNGAGKTTILHTLAFDEIEIVTNIAEIGFIVETIEDKNICLTSWDSDCQEKGRKLLNYYLRNTQGVIFVVDSTNRERIDQARAELNQLLKEDQLRDASILVLANKQDVRDAMTAAEITDKMGLHSICDHAWYIQATCATSGDGFYEGLDWLGGELTKK